MMKEYEITLDSSVIHTVLVEATSKEEAIEKVNKGEVSVDYNGLDFVKKIVDIEFLNNVENYYKYNQKLRNQVKLDIINHFKTFFSEYTIPDKIIELAVRDVFETSGISDEGIYNSSDISLACQRVIMLKV